MTPDLIDIGLMAFAVLAFTVAGSWAVRTWNEMQSKDCADPEAQSVIDKHFKL